MGSARSPAFWIGWSLILAPLVPVAGMGYTTGFGLVAVRPIRITPVQCALGLLALSAVADEISRRLGRPQCPAAEVRARARRERCLFVFWVVLVGSWTRFWLEDLHRADLGWVLAALPASGLLVAAVRWRVAAMARPGPLWIATGALVALAPRGVLALARDRWESPMVLAAAASMVIWSACFLRGLRQARPPWTPSRDPAFWRGNLGAGVVVGLAIAWPVALARTNVSCSGISDAYQEALLTTLVLLYPLGPAVLRRQLSSRRPTAAGT